MSQSACALTLLGANTRPQQRQQDPTGAGACGKQRPQIWEEKTLIKTFASATGLPRQSLGTEELWVALVCPCSGFSLCHPKNPSSEETHKPRSCTEGPRRKSRYAGACRQARSSGLHRCGAAAPRGLGFPPAGTVRCCTLFMFLWYYPACWLPSYGPHQLGLGKVNF